MILAYDSPVGLRDRFNPSNFGRLHFFTVNFLFKRFILTLLKKSLYYTNKFIELRSLYCSTEPTSMDYYGPRGRSIDLPVEHISMEDASMDNIFLHPFG